MFYVSVSLCLFDRRHRDGRRRCWHLTPETDRSGQPERSGSGSVLVHVIYTNLILNTCKHDLITI